MGKTAIMTVMMCMMFFLLATTVLADSELFINSVQINDKELEINGKIGGIEPQEETEIDIEIVNNHTDDIEDISVTVEIEDIDGGKDFEYDFKEFDLDEGKHESIDFTFWIPTEVEHDESYNLIIVVEGEEDDGDKHKDIFEARLIIEKELHSVGIESFVLAPDHGQCGDSITVPVEVVNLGRKDERDAGVLLESEELDLREIEKFELSSDPDDKDFFYSHRFSFEVPDDVHDGKYRVRLETSYDGGERSHVQTQMLEVDECKKKEEKEPPVEEKEELKEEETKKKEVKEETQDSQKNQTASQETNETVVPPEPSDKVDSVETPSDPRIVVMIILMTGFMFALILLLFLLFDRLKN